MWQPVNFTPPASIAELGKNLAGSLDSFGDSLSQGADSLGGLAFLANPARYNNAFTRRGKRYVGKPS